MANWNYTLKAGKDLRDAIDNEDYEEVLEALKRCYQELLDAEKIDSDDFDTYVDEIDEIDLYPDEDDYDYDLEEEIDFALSDFYDLCDNLRVWVDM